MPCMLYGWPSHANDVMPCMLYGWPSHANDVMPCMLYGWPSHANDDVMMWCQCVSVVYYAYQIVGDDRSPTVSCLGALLPPEHMEETLTLPCGVLCVVNFSLVTVA